MRIMVTGVAGLIGSWIAEGLIKTGQCRVIGVDDLSGGMVENIPYHLPISKDHFEFHRVDIANYSQIEEVFAQTAPDVIYHCAAVAREGASEFQPYKIAKTNLLISSILLELGIKYKMKKFIFTSCLDQEARLVTKEGLKRYSELKESQIVYSINPLTGRTEEDKIKKVHIYDYDGPMLDYQGKRVKFTVTPNHRVFFQKHSKNKTGELTYEEADVFKKRVITKLPLGKWSGKRLLNDRITFEKYKHHNNQLSSMEAEDFFYLMGLFIADGVANRSVNIMENKSGLSRDLFLSLNRDKGGRFKATPREEKGEHHFSVSHSYLIRLCVPIGDKAHNKLINILNKYNIKWSIRENGTQVHFSYHSLHDLFKEAGTNAHDKHVPEWMFEYDYSYLEKLWEGLMDGDGHYSKRGSRILTTVSSLLVRDCIELAAKIGITASFKFYKKRNTILKNGRTISGKGAYYVSFGKTQPFLFGRNFKSIDGYSGKVWCIETRNGNFLAEKDGRTFFTGNSMSVYGEGKKKPPFDEKMPRLPVDPYGVSKAATEQVIEQLSETHGFNYTIIRPHNVIGGRQLYNDRYRNVAGIFMNSIMRKEPIAIFGKDHRRAFSYIEDTLPALLNTIGNEKANREIINVGGKESVTVIELAEEIIKNMPEYPRPEIIQLPPRPHEVVDAFCTTEKSEQILGYKETYGWREGIKRMCEWAKKMGPREWIYDNLPLLNEKAPILWRK